MDKIDKNTTNQEFLDFCIEADACQEGLDWIKAHREDCPTFEKIFEHQDVAFSPPYWKLWILLMGNKKIDAEYKFKIAQFIQSKTIEELKEIFPKDLGLAHIISLLFEQLDEPFVFKLLEDYKFSYVSYALLYVGRNDIMSDREQELCIAKCADEVPHLIFEER